MNVVGSVVGEVTIVSQQVSSIKVVIANGDNRKSGYSDVSTH
jgi:hypothetical protein